MKIFNTSYESLWKAIIRPTRDNYQNRDLGPEKFEINSKFYKRTDFTLLNTRNQKLQCSFWEPYDEEREYPYLPCVIYLHGNSSSRCEAVSELKYLLPFNMTVFAFDFAGCGKSEGNYISLGYYEKFDVKCVVEFLQKTKKVSTIGIWGRSMGAVTAILYIGNFCDNNIAGIVLDSAFSSLLELIFELAKKKVNLPDFIFKEIYEMLKNTIKEKANFFLEDVEPKNYVKKCFIPAFFCHARNDSFVNIHHCKDLYNNYAGEKDILFVNGNHNTTRSKFFRSSAANFLYNALGCKYLKQICDNCDGKKFNIINDEKNNENDNLSQEQIIQNDSFVYVNNIINNNDNNNNDTNLYEDKIFQRALELTIKEYEELKATKPKNFFNSKSDNEDIINETPKSNKLNINFCYKTVNNSADKKKSDFKLQNKNKNDNKKSNGHSAKLKVPNNIIKFENKNSENDLKIIRNDIIKHSYKLESNLKKCNWKQKPILMKIIPSQKKDNSPHKISIIKKIRYEQKKINLKKTNKKNPSVQNLLKDIEIFPSNLVKLNARKRKIIHNNSFDIKEKMKNLYIKDNSVIKKHNHSQNKRNIIDEINLVPFQNHDNNEILKESNVIETFGKDSPIKINDSIYYKCKIENKC